ncbi:MAG: 4-alpha-L-fucosyltransferase [Bacteroidetes bacterium HGW-Bacteroidetes-4]|jgi:hypothetical protein|nr:MAG: 4-alpha-L-fucosyltransferase [Bacteroidetes bacterium HGW-Bacteroidetes-4]
MANYRNIHLFTQESTYATALINVWAEHLDLKGNLIVFRNKNTHQFSYAHETAKQILYIKNYLSFIFILFIKLIKAEKIIIHFLPIGPSLLFWYIFPGLLKKVTWSVWGGDVYNFMNVHNTWKSRFYEKLRQNIIPKIPHITAIIKEDFEVVKNYYGTRADYQYAFYYIPLNYSYLNTIAPKSNDSIKKILIGNSAVASNKHVEILTQLQKFAGKPVQLIVPLSYGNEGSYADSVIEYGKKTFGEQFIPLTKMLSPKDYSDLLAEIDVAIMNQVRSQGLGNVLPLLYLKKKVYLRSDSTSYKYFKRINCKIYDTLQIKNQSLTQILDYSKKEHEQNHFIITQEMSKEKCAEVWKPFVELNYN